MQIVKDMTTADALVKSPHVYSGCFQDNNTMVLYTVAVYLSREENCFKQTHTEVLLHLKLVSKHISGAIKCALMTYDSRTKSDDSSGNDNSDSDMPEASAPWDE